MIPLTYREPGSIYHASGAIDHDIAMAIAGGTTMVDLMKLNVLTPSRLVHVRDILPSQIDVQEDRIVAGAATTMADLADHPAVAKRIPVVRQTMLLAATPQIRNMATLGGNIMQRTRSAYFRHLDMFARGPEASGSGSNGGNHPGQHDGVDGSQLAVLGNGGRLVAMYPGDFAVSLMAAGATLNLVGRDGRREVPIRDFYRLPGEEAFQYSTVLEPGDLIESIEIPTPKSMASSYYLKVRERSSYAFALVSVAAGLEIVDNKISGANLGLGGLGSVPWHSAEGERVLVGKPASDETFQSAAEAALADASPPPGAEYKVPLAKRAIVRALRTIRDRGVMSDRELFETQHGRTSS